MLLLLFELGESRYALATDQIVEVVPLVRFKRIPRAPEYVAGLMNYRGSPIPVIDLGLLAEGRPCAPRLSTRVILVNFPAEDKKERLLGLIAERVTETTQGEQARILSSGILMDEDLYRRDGEADREQMIQWLDLKRMIPEEAASLLFAD